MYIPLLVLGLKNIIRPTPLSAGLGISFLALPVLLLIGIGVANFGGGGSFTAAEQREIDNFLSEYGIVSVTKNDLTKSVDVEDNTLLHNAAANEQLAVVRYLISKGANVNAKNRDGWTPLHWVAHLNKDIKVARLLVSKRANVNAKTNSGYTPLEWAKSMDHASAAVVQYLESISGTPAPTEQAEGNVALQSNSTSPDVNAKDERGRTQLHLAARRGDLENVKSLISKGANVNARDEYGDTPLLDTKNVEVVKYLVSQGANVNTSNKNGFTLLHTAAYEGDVDVVKFLISKGANVNAKNIDGTTPLLHTRASSEYLETVKILVLAGADVNAKDNRGNYTPLFWAAHYGNIEVAKFLISKGADVNAKDNIGRTLLHRIKRNNNLIIIEYLESVGAR